MAAAAAGQCPPGVGAPPPSTGAPPSEAAIVEVLGRFEPFFSRLLQFSGPDECQDGLNPSPFDLRALLCASRLLGHLRSATELRPRSAPSSAQPRCRALGGSPSPQGLAEAARERLAGPVRVRLPWVRQRLRSKQVLLSKRISCRLTSKRRPPTERIRPNPCPLLRSLVESFVQERVAEGLRGAVCRGDLDAVRFCVEAGANEREGMAFAVRYTQLGVLKLLLSRAAHGSADGRVLAPPAGPTRASLLHEAMAVFLSRKGSAQAAEALAVVDLLASVTPGLDQPIWPLGPEIGEEERTTQVLMRGCRPASPPALPLLRRGDSPLAWLVHAYVESCNGILGHEAMSPQLSALAQSLVRHGASRDSLHRRKHKSLDELLSGIPCHSTEAHSGLLELLRCRHGPRRPGPGAAPAAPTPARRPRAGRPGACEPRPPGGPETPRRRPGPAAAGEPRQASGRKALRASQTV